MCKPKLLIFSMLLAGGAHAQAPAIGVSQNTGSVGKYDVYELAISHQGSYQNPWEDPSITASFQSPSGSVYTIGGFYYDTNTWKVRFAPREAGAWTWNLTFSNSAGSAVANGSFTSTSSSSGGFLRVHPGNPYVLITEADGKPFYPLGLNDVISDWTGPAGSPDGSIATDWVLSSNPALPAQVVSIDTYFNTFGTAGLNMFRFNGEFLIDIADFNTKTTGKNLYSVSLGKQRDELAVALHKANFKALWAFLAIPDSFVPAWDISDPTKRSALLKYHQYVINRFAAYVDIWELANERFGMTQAYIDTVTSYIKANDPYSHPITTSYSPNPPQAVFTVADTHLYFDTPSLDLDYQLVSGTYGTTNTRASTPNKVQIWGEVGNRCPINGNDAANERFRIMVWTGFFNQAFIVPWHNSSGASSACAAGLTNLYIGPAQRTHASVFRKYVSDFDPLATPVSFNVSAGQRGYAMGSSTDLGAYLIQTQSHTTVLSGATVTVNVGSAGMTGQWINPQDGSIISTFSPAAGTQTLGIPAYTTDIVLRIKGTSGAPPPSPCDLDGDGSISGADVNAAINQVLNPQTCGTADLDKNGRCDVIDVQRVVNAVVTGVCKVGP